MAKATSLMQAHWQWQRDHGKPVKPLWALVSQGSEQPVGYVKGWALVKRHVEAQREKQWEPDTWTIELIQPV